MNNSTHFHTGPRAAFQCAGVLAALLLLATPVRAQFNPCNYLGITSGSGPLTLIAPGRTIVDGGSVDGSSSNWCSIGHLTVSGGAQLINGRAQGTKPVTTFQNGFVFPNNTYTDSSLINDGTVMNGAFGLFINNVPLINQNLLMNAGVMNNTAPRGGIGNDNGAVFINTGTLNLAASQQPGVAVFMNFGGLVDNSGAFNNSGVAVSLGTVNNSGNLRVFSGGSFVLDAGTFTNTGVVTSDAGGSFETGASSRFLNSPTGSVVNNGALRIGGEFSNALQVRNAANADMTILAGGRFVNMGATGSRLENSGTLTNSGELVLEAGSQFDNIGRFVNLNTVSSTGVLVNPTSGTLENRGAISASSILNTGSIDHVVGTINTSADLRNEGQLRVRAGSVTVAGTLTVDIAPNATPETPLPVIYIDGGRLAAQGTLVVAVYYGAIYVQPGGQLDVNRLQNAGYITNHGEVLVRGIGLPAAPGSDSFFVQTGAGAVTVVDGKLISDYVQIEGGALAGTGTVQAGSVFVLGALLAPGPYNGLTIEPPLGLGRHGAAAVQTGMLTLDGDLTFIDSRLQFDIAGTGEGQFDVLRLLRRASFSGGTLELSFADGYLPAQGDHWELLLSGSEDTTGLDTLQPVYGGLPAGYGFSVQLGAGGVGITVTQTGAVPEPTSAALIGAGLLALLRRFRRSAVLSAAPGATAGGPVTA